MIELLFQAEFNRRSGGHIGHASAEKYRRNNGKHWHAFVASKAKEWEEMNAAWRDAYADNAVDLLVVGYDALRSDPEGQLRRVLRFLGVSGADALDLTCAMERREGMYKRPKKQLNFDVFDETMRKDIASRRERTYARLGLKVEEVTTPTGEGVKL